LGDWARRRMDEFDNSAIRPPIAIGATMEEREKKRKEIMGWWNDDEPLMSLLCALLSALCLLQNRK
jgi:hypothetical protein